MKDMINPNVLDMVPYKPGKPIEELQREYNLERVVKLASNENPSGVSPHVADAIKNEIPNLNFYPENDSYYLRHRIAEYNGIPAENVIVSAGSVELIRMIVSTFLHPGQTVLTSEKTFLMYKIAAIEKGGKNAFIEAPMRDDHTYDLDAIYRLVDDKTKIIFIANPNNPTGTMVNKQEVMDFIHKVPENKIIVFDNAYQEYVSNPDDYPDGIAEAVNRKNVIVLRTFSKIYSLSGLRVGYGVAHGETISYLNRVKPPFNVTRLAQAAAMASLENDDFKHQSAALNSKNKEKLFFHLKEIGLQVIPTETNFLFFFPGVDTVELNQRLLKEGVIIRPLHAFGVPEAMRVTVGLAEDNNFFIEKLRKVLGEI
ncbi:MAG: histidinol-phosphate transaminase [Candidatus Aminicenantes bacterium]|nr:MAG: histidinol-phosphate transaminase [Candidatus Aminicenantes bacterium]